MFMNNKITHTQSFLYASIKSFQKYIDLNKFLLNINVFILHKIPHQFKINLPF